MTKRTGNRITKDDIFYGGVAVASVAAIVVTAAAINAIPRVGAVPNSPSPNPSPSSGFSFTVLVESSSGQTVPNAIVTYAGTSAISDSTGTATFNGITTTIGSLTITASGYAAYTQNNFQPVMGGVNPILISPQSPSPSPPPSSGPSPSPPPTGGTATLTVGAQTTTGALLDGYFVEIDDPTTGAQLFTGYTPATFTLNIGQNYIVLPTTNPGGTQANCNWDYWLDNQTIAQRREFALSTSIEIISVYQCA